ncbi:ABC transporter substrate-binding protein [Bifidobacterium callimiconis]|uniref:ABC transporter substrate-binding protein n=1 Tax=Bifidobacterium callimiconis TaxID=2306973 RepID=A0A430FGP9_9BIFI|nr:extracellular solute-binding protein [Bifidobacterium callimiconis]MBT1176646.1 extracellular solute-binding protein [Bifidobacterium callimiconis]RSX51898.1 ABC transporter substrate-binding protein [Bifidobacterium callimiconis]
MRTSIKKLLAAGAAGAMLFSLAACGGDSASSDDESGPVTIRFAWWGSDTRAKAQEKVIDAFEKANPNIKVETETSNYDDYITKLSTSAAADDLPDVMTMIDPFMADYMDNGSLLDLNEVSDNLDLSKFSKDTFSGATGENGEKYGVSMGVSSHGLVINTKVFEKYGVEVPNDDTWSWDDFENAAKQISEKSGGEAVGYSIDMTEQLGRLWLRQNGEDYGIKGKEQVGFKPETLAKFYEFEKKLIDEGATNSADQAQEMFAAGNAPEQQPISQDKAGISLISMNQLGQFEQAAGHELKPVMWPGETQAKERGGWTKQGTFVSINANTEHKAAAAKLVNFLVNNEEAAKIMGLDRGVPANPDMAKAIESQLSDSDKRFSDWVTKLQKVNTQEYTNMNAGAATVITEAYGRAHESVMFGKATPLDAAKSFKSELQQAVTQ